MKKILISILIIGVVAAIAIGGTVAYFSQQQQRTAARSRQPRSTWLPDSDGGAARASIRASSQADPAVVKYVENSQRRRSERLCQGPTLATGAGTATLLNALHVKVTLLGATQYPGVGGNYPDGDTYPSYDGPLSRPATSTTVGHNNPIMPGQHWRIQG